ncbi:hypothetical protein GGI42DRAFT_347229 [Trichoderma sp. SZMC 28013]
MALKTPTVELTKIKDELTNSQKGYSFKECLSRRDRWNWGAVYKYKRKEEVFRGLLGLAMHVTGGQTPRWSQLLSLWCENGEFGERNIYVYGGSMAYLIRHHKAKRSTNREFIVVRFLPAEVAHLLYKYLAHIRRFVDLLERERGFSGQSAVDSSPLLFRSGNAPTSKPWPTAVTVLCNVQ